MLNVSKTVITLGLCTDLPNYVRETLSLGPKSAVLDKVNPKDILAELDLLLDFCKRHEIEDSVITDINEKILANIKKCQKQKSQRNITMTKPYIKENDLLAIPFDKGIGICVMDKQSYQTRLDKIKFFASIRKSYSE